MVELTDADALQNPNPPDALAASEVRVSKPLCSCSRAADWASIWKRIDAAILPESMTMRCMPICTIVASICWRLRASELRTKGISSWAPVPGIAASGSRLSAARTASIVGGAHAGISRIGSGTSSGSGTSRGSGGSGSSMRKLWGNCSASQRLAGSSLDPPVEAKPSSDCETPRTSSIYCRSCCWLVSTIARKMPLISSATKRGKLIARRTAWVVPATPATAVPET